MLELTAPVLFMAGVAGSPHCALMCAPLQTLALRGPIPFPRALLLLHGGRVLGYGLLGTAAGALGARGLSLLPATSAGQALQLAAAAVLLGTGLLQWRTTTVRCLAHRAPPPVPAHHQGATSPRMLMRGLAWSTLPCAMVYALLVLAALSGGAGTGALLLLAYGLGTVPLLAISARVFGRLQPLASPAGRRAGAALLMLLALASAAATLRHGGSVLPLWCRALLA
ncbi:MAG TPA: sulfite exporter TauE/SafE family protein [Solimonas sp.]|nr:sulfite exporter TauE/SafE family protein [Solimonas sp.]